MFNRREAKILTTIVSQFTSYFLFYWKDFFEIPMKYPPSFDGRIVLYPTDQSLFDYLSWRQVDCHINNLYNTTFWALVLKGNLSKIDAENKLNGTLSKDKNEILHEQFGINYNNENEMYKKGTTIIRHYYDEEGNILKQYPDNRKMKKKLTTSIEQKPCDLMKENPLHLEHSN